MDRRAARRDGLQGRGHAGLRLRAREGVVQQDQVLELRRVRLRPLRPHQGRRARLHPVLGVRTRAAAEVEGSTDERSNRYRQALMKARGGERVILEADELACPAASRMTRSPPRAFISAWQ